MRKRTLILVIGLVICGIGFTVYRVFFLRMARVPTSSMANTILPGDYVLITKSFAQVERGTLILFQYDPEFGGVRDRYRGDTDYYIARVIGLPGETIQIRGRTVYINGQPLQEQKVVTAEDRDFAEPLQELSTEGSGPYRVFYSRTPDDESAFSEPGTFGSETPFQIPKDLYFVMGDNRHNSMDSRFRGPVPRNLIWGKASLIYYSATMNTEEPRWERVFKKIH